MKLTLLPLLRIAANYGCSGEFHGASELSTKATIERFHHALNNEDLDGSLTFLHSDSPMRQLVKKQAEKFMRDFDFKSEDL